MIAIIKNEETVGPGSIEHFLKEHSIFYRIYEAQKGETPIKIEDYKALIILGGTMGVYEMDTHPHLKGVIRIIEEAIDKNIMVLGICLGAQLIAYTLGARVFKGFAEEIGWQEIELTADGLRDPLMLSFSKHPFVGDLWRKFRVFQWHRDTFTLPNGAVNLAKSALYENQAFRYRNNVYALQFHIEITKDLLVDWFENHPSKAQIFNNADKLILECYYRAKNFYRTFWEEFFSFSSMECNKR